MAIEETTNMGTGANGKKKPRNFFTLRRTGAIKINVQTHIIFLI